MLKNPRKRAFGHFTIGRRNAPPENAASGQAWSSVTTQNQSLILLGILPAYRLPACSPFLTRGAVARRHRAAGRRRDRQWR